MDCTELEYQDESFDTVVDTFGLQASHNYQKQYEEMKRVCKNGGKILLLEMGESLWLSSNYKIMKNSQEEFISRGQHLYRNWDQLIMKDKSVKVIKHIRKMNGSLFYYELQKLY
jgi:ubiquinone/menaquinone biosynthesis C-methylase UbiE